MLTLQQCCFNKLLFIVCGGEFRSVLVVFIRHHQKHDYVNYDRFAQNFDMAYKTIQRVSAPNLKVLSQWKPSYGPKNFENFLLCYMGKLANMNAAYKCIEIF